jgi:hypothetical protein
VERTWDNQCVGVVHLEFNLKQYCWIYIFGMIHVYIYK